MKNIRSKVTGLFLAAIMLISTAFPVFAADSNDSSDLLTAPSVSKTVVSGTTDKIYFGTDQAYLKAITGVSVNDTALAKGSYAGETGKYYIYTSSSYNSVSVVGLNAEDIIKIEATGYKTLYLKVDSVGSSSMTLSEYTPTDNSSGNEGDTNPDNSQGSDNPSTTRTATAPEFTNVSSGFSAYYQLAFSDEGYVAGISKVLVNGEACEAGFSPTYLSGTQYYKDSDANKLYLASTSWGSAATFKNGDIVTISSDGFEDLSLKVTIAGSTVSITPVTQDSGDSAEDEYKLYVRLTGYFESALVNQSGYDAISGASTNVTQNQNSNAEVEAVLVSKDTDYSDIPEDSWKPLNETDIKVNKSETKVNLDEASGMIGVYSTYDSSITLSGTPKTAGTYDVSVTVTDSQGRTATSNSLTFKVYSGEEKLIDQMVTENFRNGEAYWDGKYIWDIEPWAIKNFGGDNETVTVPTDLKAIYGSNTSGTYGELGYAIPEGDDTTQTLVIPDGCSLTLVNMDVLSSVRILVQEGGKLTLMDSVIQGVVEVDGGTFSMYDSSSINGQVVLNDGSTLGDSVIYSNTNFIANGSEARHNSSPVLVINGNVNLDGNVYIKGDESPTGTDADTGKEYAGQTGLLVNGTLNISEGSTLAVYGGGHYMTTSLGGSAVKINNGAITGAGSLVAIGGSGSKEGGDAISGTGTISTANVFAQGGNSVYKDGTAGSAIASTVAISNATNRSLTDGTVGGGFDVDNYWGDITSVPDLALYTVEANAPGDAGDDGSLDKDSDPGKGDENGDADNDPESSKGDTLDTGKLPTGSTTTIIKTTKITKESAKLSPNTGETFPVAMVGFMLVMAAIMALMIGLLSLKKNIINRG